MPKDKDPPRGPQPFNRPFAERLDQSPNWRRIRQAHEAIERLRERGLPPQITPEGRDRLKQNQPRDDLRAVKSTRQLAEQRERQETVQPSPSEPAETIQTPPSEPAAKRKTGRPRIEPPHLLEALAAMEKKWPTARHSPVSERHILFIIDYCRDHGDDLERDYNETAGTVREKRDRSIRRRIEEWQRSSR